MTSKTAKLLKLHKKHPKWTTKQFAEILGQSEATIRGVLSRKGVSLKDKKKFPVKRAKKLCVPANDGHRVFSRSGPRSYGYLKLM